MKQLQITNVLKLSMKYTWIKKKRRRAKSKTKTENL